MPAKWASREAAVAAFWARLSRLPSGCWEWPGATAGKGYGVVRIDGRNTYCHRLAYLEAVGPIPGRLMVLHDCDNPPCCNPAHLFLGTNGDNVRDMLAKGRARGCKITPEQALAIRRSKLTARALATKHGLCCRHVRDIRKGRAWKDGA